MRSISWGPRVVLFWRPLVCLFILHPSIHLVVTESTYGVRPLSHGRFGPAEKETVEIELRDEKSKGETKLTKSREVFI